MVRSTVRAHGTSSAALSASWTGSPGWSSKAEGGKNPNTVDRVKTSSPSARHRIANDTMIISPVREIEVSSASVRTVRVAGVTSPVTVPLPSRLRKSRSMSAVSGQPT